MHRYTQSKGTYLLTLISHLSKKGPFKYQQVLAQKLVRDQYNSFNIAFCIFGCLYKMLPLLFVKLPLFLVYLC